LRRTRRRSERRRGSFSFASVISSLIFSPSNTMHVVIAHYNEDLSWVTGLKYPFTIVSRNGIPKDVAPNKGNEASVFLDYIIKNYDTLDDYTFFVHGHRSSWHHAEPMDEKINRTVCSRPYFGLNDIPAYRIMDCPSTTQQLASGYPPLERLLGPIDMNRISFRMGGQFYVHRDAVHSRSLDTYKALYDYIMGNVGCAQTDGILFERLWHFIFTNDVVDA
jgi:hypothetical protein